MNVTQNAATVNGHDEELLQEQIKEKVYLSGSKLCQNVFKENS